MCAFEQRRFISGGIEVALKIYGFGLITLGLALVWNPELVSSKPVPNDTFEAIERRIWWGLIIGFGCLLLFHQQLKPWVTTIAATGSALIFGLLVARLMGIMLDGSVAKQWLYVGIELVILAPLVAWYLRIRA